MASGAKCCFVTFFGKYAVQKLMMDIFTISCRKLGKHLVSSPVSFKRSKLLCLINAQFTSYDAEIEAGYIATRGQMMTLMTVQCIHQKC